MPAPCLCSSSSIHEKYRYAACPCVAPLFLKKPPRPQIRPILTLPPIAGRYQANLWATSMVCPWEGSVMEPRSEGRPAVLPLCEQGFQPLVSCVLSKKSAFYYFNISVMTATGARELSLPWVILQLRWIHGSCRVNIIFEKNLSATRCSIPEKLGGKTLDAGQIKVRFLSFPTSEELILLVTNKQNRL